MRASLFALALSLIQQTALHAQVEPPDTLAIEHATVLPMDRDTVLIDHTVLVSRGRVIWLGPSADARVPRGAERVDGRGAYLMPGLADMHVHLRTAQDLTQLVLAGVTTVRNMHGVPNHLAWRAEVARGAIVGPTILTAGPPIGEGDDRFVPLRTTAEVESVVRQQGAAGYDMIKVIGPIRPDLYERLLLTSRAARIPVVGHVVNGVELDLSLAAGQISLEHAYALRQRSRLAALFGDGQAVLDADATAIARAGAWVGTITSSRNGRCDQRTPDMLNRVATLHRARVKLLAGTDAGIGPVEPGSSLHCELATLVQAGLTPYEAISTATVNAGEFARTHFKRDPVPFGTVTVGARADLLLLTSDPRLGIAALGDLKGVLLRGVWTSR